MKKNISVISFILLIPLLWGCGKEDGIGRTAPDFTLEDFSGKTVSLNHYQGRIVLLDFWATWCPPCRQSIPELVEIQDKYRDKGVVVLGVSMDDPLQITGQYMSAFKEKFKINYMILKADPGISRDYFGTDRMAIPTMFVINREGKIVDKFVGFRPGAVEEAIREHL